MGMVVWSGLLGVFAAWRLFSPWTRGPGAGRTDPASPSLWLVLPGDTAVRPGPEPLHAPQLTAPAAVRAVLGSDGAFDWGRVRQPIHHDLGPTAALPVAWLVHGAALRFDRRETGADLGAELGGFADAATFPIWQLAPDARTDFLFG